MSEKSSSVASRKCKVVDEDGDEEIKQTKERKKILSEANTKSFIFIKSNLQNIKAFLEDL